MKRLTLVAALLLGACAGSAALDSAEQARAGKELAKALEGRASGKPQSCIGDYARQSPQVIDSHTVLYRDGSTVWRNDLRARCPSLTPYKTMVVELHGAQLCQNDRFRVLEPGTSIPGGYCVFGDFTPYRKLR